MYKKPSSGKRGNLSQFGLLDVDIPDVDDDEPLDGSDDDIDLEAELAAISGGGGKPRPKKRVPAVVADLDSMIAASLRDIPSDEDVSGDEDDPDLLRELQSMSLDDEAPTEQPRATRPAPPPPGSAASSNSTINLLQQRISNYTLAEKNAKQAGESSKARRYGRGLKTLNDLLKQAKAGRPIKDEDIPPPVSLGKPDSQPPESQPSPPEQPLTPPEPTPPMPPPRSTSIPSAPEPEERPPTPPEPKEPPPPPPDFEAMDPAKQEGLQVILKRKEEFKAAALASKHAGDKAMALEYLKVVKQFDIVVEAYKSGQEMDLNELPTTEAIAAAVRDQQKGEDQTQNSSEPAPEPAPEPVGLITASTVDEALRQRLAHFQEQEAKAKEEGNSSKARRMGRIVKQYQDAVRLNAAGKPFSAEDLPTPNGYAPLPTSGSHPSSSTPAPSTPKPAPSPRPAPKPATPQQPTRYDKQLALLLHRQKQFKEAAILAKKNGDIAQAKEYLRAAKGFDSVIEAAEGGLTVDLKSLPLPPTAKKQIEDTFDVVSTEDCGPPDDTAIRLDDEDVMSRLHQQLTSQLKLCLTNRDHYRAMGNIAESNRFEHLAVSVKQDLDVVAVAKRLVMSRLHQQLTSQLKLCLTNRDHYRAMGNIAESNRFEHLAVSVKQDLDVVAVAKSLGENPPKFHYENRKFSVVQCNTDLNENDLELTIVRGIAYNVPNPKDVDTYVKFEFPFPQEAPVSDRTPLVKDTNSPQYDAVFTLPIQRGARPCLRVFKRHGIKLELYSRGGWFSKDSLLGGLTVKLAPLETQVTLHEAFPLMDGRRPAGGSLEVKLRVRTPLLQQQVESTTHRWLVIDN
ncbi:coiled-coil and C2 domain-containing protein 1-like isoform X2 [Bicyclus anynana]|uniref:Coiled-coil and C2 domain-containing protein 1-like isoform X2 n=1 Tax=Bicyclus anynana TaxID=110368 RepID=A0ABM3M7A1_BICAN|nr:coiled-coil and C2 domain-containing protein 1-like isoform X2 [Bicyclus anynana]